MIRESGQYSTVQGFMANFLHDPIYVYSLINYINLISNTFNSTLSTRNIISLVTVSQHVFLAQLFEFQCNVTNFNTSLCAGIV